MSRHALREYTNFGLRLGQWSANPDPIEQHEDMLWKSLVSNRTRTGRLREGQVDLAYEYNPDGLGPERMNRGQLRLIFAEEFANRDAYDGSEHGMLMNRTFGEGWGRLPYQSQTRIGDSFREWISRMEDEGVLRYEPQLTEGEIDPRTVADPQWCERIVERRDMDAAEERYPGVNLSFEDDLRHEDGVVVERTGWRDGMRLLDGVMQQRSRIDEEVLDKLRVFSIAHGPLNPVQAANVAIQSDTMKYIRPDADGHVKADMEGRGNGLDRGQLGTVTLDWPDTERFQASQLSRMVDQHQVQVEPQSPCGVMDFEDMSADAQNLEERVSSLISGYGLDLGDWGSVYTSMSNFKERVEVTAEAPNGATIDFELDPKNVSADQAAELLAEELNSYAPDPTSLGDLQDAEYFRDAATRILFAEVQSTDVTEQVMQDMIDDGITR